jgi:phycocyanobilin lyase beta subunit
MTLSLPLRERIQAVEQASSALSLLEATRALADHLASLPGAADHSGDTAGTPTAAGPDQQAAAIACLVEVLGFNNPGAAVAAVDGLIALGAPAVEPLLQRLDPRNYGARAWAVRALAGIGDVRGLELLEEALASDVGPSVRRAAACGLGNLRLDALAEPLRPAVRSRALEALVAGCRDGEWVVRYAVAVGLEALVQRMQPSAEESRRAAEALDALCCSKAEDTPVVRLRASMARQRLPITP